MSTNKRLYKNLDALSRDMWVRIRESGYDEYLLLRTDNKRRNRLRIHGGRDAFVRWLEDIALAGRTGRVEPKPCFWRQYGMDVMRQAGAAPRRTAHEGVGVRTQERVFQQVWIRFGANPLRQEGT